MTLRSGGQGKIFLAFLLQKIATAAATDCSQSVPDVWTMGVYVMSRLTVCKMKGLAAAAEGNHSIHGHLDPKHLFCCSKYSSTLYMFKITTKKNKRT